MVDWINSHAMLKKSDCTIAAGQNHMWDWRRAGVLIYDDALLIGRNIIVVNVLEKKKNDVWAGIGVRGGTEEWVANVNVVWTEVTGLCGFCDRICQQFPLWCRYADPRFFTQSPGIGHDSPNMRSCYQPEFPRC